MRVLVRVYALCVACASTRVYLPIRVCAGIFACVCVCVNFYASGGERVRPPPV